jgi:hypothetical protein
MKRTPPPQPAPKSTGHNSLAVRFPRPADPQHVAVGPRLSLGDLLPRRWRRRVVIQGQSFWLPG